MVSALLLPSTTWWQQLASCPLTLGLATPQPQSIALLALKEQKEQKAEKTALSWAALKLLSWEWWWLPAPCPSSASWALLKQKSVQGESLYQVPAHSTKQSLVFLWLWLLGP